MDNQSLLLQHRALIEFEQFLQKFQYQINNDLKYYNDKIQQLRMDGVPVEVCEKYQNHYAQPKVVKLNGLIQQIAEKDLKYVNKVTQKITDALNTAK
ncbi:MAG: hypothetical protein JXL97_11265 [Bacteroidales bacterium]|nr:hypothetical protein [Bacteroidales bacterium]